MHARLPQRSARACPHLKLRQLLHGIHLALASQAQGDISFHATRDKLLPRPWVVDDLDALLDRLCRWAAGRAGAPRWLWLQACTWVRLVLMLHACGSCIRKKEV